MSTFLVVAMIQGAAILTDEFVFHRKRGLPKWEVISHPIDTLLVIGCLLFLIFFDPTPVTTAIYLGMVVTSSILVTKDEWVHKKYCSGTEMWLHAVLFLVHPILLLTAMTEWTTSRSLFAVVAVAVTGFLVYQLIYWVLVVPALRRKRQAAHYRRPNQDEFYEYFSE